MKIQQKIWVDGKWTDGAQSQLQSQQVGRSDVTSIEQAAGLPGVPQIVLVFGGRAVVEKEETYKEIRSMYPDPLSHILSCSTAGEIAGTEVRDGSISLTAVYFEKTELAFAESDIKSYEESYEVGRKLAGQLVAKAGQVETGGGLAGEIGTKRLVHVMVFSDGQKVNGTRLVDGFNDALPQDISVTGGLVGDGADFKKTVVGLDETARQGNIVAIGFYGQSLRVGYGSLGGWDPFGLERTITKSKDNVLYELDGQPALKLYKEYLGELAKGLPSTGLLFPLRLRVKNVGKEGEKEVEVVRTILNVNEADQSMTFAGDMPEGVPATLMKANFERLIDGASGAGSMSTESLENGKAELAILISCIGRKLVLKERVEEEIEAVRDAIGEQAVLAGFYSYGELCPVASTEKQCELHNQTMTITAFREV